MHLLRFPDLVRLPDPGCSLCLHHHCDIGSVRTSTPGPHLTSLLLSPFLNSNEVPKGPSDTTRSSGELILCKVTFNKWVTGLGRKTADT